jgi:hypothetical protein
MQTHPPLKKVEPKNSTHLKNIQKNFRVAQVVAEPNLLLEKVEQNVELRRSQRLLKNMQMNDILAPPFSKVDFSKVDVDFDEASKAWRENKKSIGNGSFKYICCADKNGKKCGIKCIEREIYCRSHYKKFASF